MAKAKIVEKSKKPKQRVKLTLTMAEAETLLDMSTRIGGSPTTSPRKHADTITDALHEIGIAEVDFRVSPFSHSINYLNYDGTYSLGGL